jgi:ATP-dependent DNA helicase RecG
MKNNRSDEPIFEMDDARSYFLTILKIRKFDTLSDGKPPVNRRIPPDTTTQEQKILEYIIENTAITSKTVEALLDVKDSRAKELLRNLSHRKLVIKQGQARSTHYILGEGND